MLGLNICCLSRLTQLNTQLFSFPQTCASSGENYRLRRKTLVVNCLTIGAAPCILTRNATGLFHLHGPNQESYVSRVFTRFFCFSLFTQKKCSSSSFIAKSKVVGCTLPYSDKVDMFYGEVSAFPIQRSLQVVFL